MDKLLEILNRVNDESSLEELRRAVADALDAAADVGKDIGEYQNIIDELTKSNGDKDFEITRLKEENGRLFRDRLEDKTRKITEEVEEKTEAEIIDELRAGIDI